MSNIKIHVYLEIIFDTDFIGIQYLLQLSGILKCYDMKFKYNIKYEIYILN
ncbi:MAG: hypothetical protein Sylvanvirus14_18 [Sylvanvirus sp.]|uniref:Uncharacterized protein n=1 Tax=Sylvanvirus sp. TaxID=2487774 RepID=A0A3G5AKS8_9VIRU|nr:MAG: hypothetical protein Sylvanvirus14_18 [Sylvanvirus sp.]